jgi:hypothetical protein
MLVAPAVFPGKGVGRPRPQIAAKDKLRDLICTCLRATREKQTGSSARLNYSTGRKRRQVRAITRMESSEARCLAVPRFIKMLTAMATAMGGGGGGGGGNWWVCWWRKGNLLCG